MRRLANDGIGALKVVATNTFIHESVSFLIDPDDIGFETDGGQRHGNFSPIELKVGLSRKIGCREMDNAKTFRIRPRGQGHIQSIPHVGGTDALHFFPIGRTVLLKHGDIAAVATGGQDNLAGRHRHISALAGCKHSGDSTTTVL